MTAPQHRTPFEKWTLMLHEALDEQPRPSKTGEYEKSLVSDPLKHQFIGRGSCMQLYLKKLDQPLVDVDQPTFALELRRTGKLLGIHPPPLPSSDFVNSSRRLEDIDRRRRWRSDASLRHYEKRSKIAKQFASLEPTIQLFCLA